MRFLSRAFVCRGLGVMLALTMWPVVHAAEVDPPAPPPAQRLYVNDKRVPDDLKDLRKIQEALQGGLARALEATVGIKLGQGSGSGVIVSEDGLILTAAHVAGGVDKKLTIVLEDGTELEARSLGLNSNTDAAMVKIVGEDDRTFPMVEMDLSDSARLGDWVFSLGHSGGVDRDRGAVVRIGRLVKVSQHTLQSDCNLIGGDSGGPLFDMNGRLIGIHSRVGQTLEENMHVPLREFQHHWVSLLNGDFIGEGPFAERPEPGTAFLGVALEDAGESQGVRITKVAEDTPAEEAGLREGDVIKAYAGEEVADKEALLALIEKAIPGDRVSLEIQRDGESKDIEVELGKR